MRVIEGWPEGIPPLGVTRFSAPDGTQALYFSKPWEFQMGATYYAAAAVGTAPETAANLELPGLKDCRFLVPGLYRPWTHDGSGLLLTTFEKPPVLFDLRKKQARMVKVPETVHAAAICSPTAPVAFLLNFGNKGNFIALTGDLTPKASIDLPANLAGAFWLKDGRNLLVVRQEKKRARLQVFPEFATAPTVDFAIDPDKLIPYEKEKYRKLNRAHGVLRQGSSVLAGMLLDVWNRSHFEPETGTLYLMVQRPVSDPAPDDGLEPGTRREMMCRVEPKWVEICLE